MAELREDEDEAYFSSYGHYGIHEEMLKVWLVHTHANTDTRSRMGQQVSSGSCEFFSWETRCYTAEN